MPDEYETARIIPVLLVQSTGAGEHREHIAKMLRLPKPQSHIVVDINRGTRLYVDDVELADAAMGYLAIAYVSEARTAPIDGIDIKRG